VDLLILGPLEVRADGVLVPLGGAKPRAMLAALLLHPNEVVSVDRLTDALWGDQPPPSAAANIKTYASQLRKAVDGGLDDPRLVTRAPGYLFRVEPGELDLAVFGDLAEAGRSALAGGDFELAAGRLGEALSLWRGDVCADVTLGPDLDVARSSLDEQRLAVTEDCLEARLRRGEHRELIPELRWLVAAHPLRERLWEYLMLALSSAGRPADALAAYTACRDAFVRELGLEPGTRLRNLQAAILANDTPGPDTHVPALPGQAATGSREPVVPRELPAAVAHFAGRAGELAVLTGLADQAGEQGRGMVVISAIGGTAGVGKTALAVHWAHQVAERFPDGQLYVNLRGFDPSGAAVAPAEAVRRFLDALGVPAGQVPASAEAQQGLYRSLLTGRRMLIVLDNARDADQVRPLLPASSGCLVLVTSRSQLASLVAAEGAHPVLLDVLSREEALGLLERRIGTGRMAAELAAATELTGLCAGLPLALAIAAARAALHPGLPLATLVTELRDAAGRLDALDAGDAGASVRAVFSWSYRQLPESAARVFRLLGVHPGPDITAPAAASLAGIPLGQARQALGQLTRASLLTEHSPGRFAFHDLLRAYAAELAGAEDGDTARREATHRMLDHYLHTAVPAGFLVHPASDPLALAPARPGVVPEVIVGREQAMAWFEAEHQVLLAVIVQTASTGFDTHAWQLPVALTTFLALRGYWRDSVAAQQMGLAAARRLGDLSVQARVHRNLAHVSVLLGSYQDARAHAGRALELCRQLGDRAGQGRAHTGLAEVCDGLGRYDEALAHDMQALDLYRSLGNRRWEAISLNNLGWCHAKLGDYQQALACSEQALALHQELGDRNEQASTWDSVGYARHHLGQYPEAIACYQQALALARELGHRFNLADVLIHLGDSYAAAGQPSAAREAWQQALDILDDLYHPRADDIRARLRSGALAGRGGGVRPGDDG
jgi:DNA-binding SARP family transcriptional activator/tetratricopeptide (TPR) repeat protein